MVECVFTLRPYTSCKETPLPSIHFLYPLNPSVGSWGGAGAYPSSQWARGGVHPGQVASPSQGHTETSFLFILSSCCGNTNIHPGLLVIKKQPKHRQQLLSHWSFFLHNLHPMKKFLLLSAEGFLIHIWNDRGTLFKRYVQIQPIHCCSKRLNVFPPVMRNYLLCVWLTRC